MLRFPTAILQILQNPEGVPKVLRSLQIYGNLKTIDFLLIVVNVFFHEIYQTNSANFSILKDDAP